MGGWKHADKYVLDIINVKYLLLKRCLILLQSLNNWVTGWVDWNLALDFHGGPNWVGNFVDAPIIVSNTSDEFEKQPMYYGMGHIRQQNILELKRTNFSKYIVPNSTVITYNLVNNTNINLVILAAIDPDQRRVIVLDNRDESKIYNVSIINKNGAPLNLALEPQSFTTVIYNEVITYIQGHVANSEFGF